MSKTMSIRMDRENYAFVHKITKEEKSDLSKTVRDLVSRGRILLAIVPHAVHPRAGSSRGGSQGGGRPSRACNRAIAPLPKECRIDLGPGYRIYFGKEGDRLVILVGGEQRIVSRKTSRPRWPGGKTTNKEKNPEGDSNGSDARFQGNNPGSRKSAIWFPQGASSRGNRKLPFG